MAGNDMRDTDRETLIRMEGKIDLVVAAQARAAEDQRALSDRVTGQSTRLTVMDNKFTLIDTRFATMDGERKGIASTIKFMYALWGVLGTGGLLALIAAVARVKIGG